MIEINKDYSEIRSQLVFISNYLSHCFNPLERVSYISCFDDLQGSIGEENKYYLSNHSSIRFIQSLLEAKQSLCLDNLLKENIRNHFSYHQNFLNTVYPLVCELLEEAKGEYSLPSSFHAFKKKSKKPRQIASSFLKEEDSTLYDIFQDICKYRRIYYNKIDKDNFCIYNNLQGIPNIFLSFHPHTIYELNFLIHELGHVMDASIVGSSFLRQDLIYDYFDNRKLEEAGLYPDVLAHHYVKKMREIMR